VSTEAILVGKARSAPRRATHIVEHPFPQRVWLEIIKKSLGFCALALPYAVCVRLSSTLRSTRSLRLKTLYATYRLVDLHEQNVGIFRIQLALSNQSGYLNIMDGGEGEEGVLDLALRELGARALKLADQARSILLVREGVEVVGVVLVGQKSTRLGYLCLAVTDDLSFGGRSDLQ
jgi:hypothetical protein